MLKPFAERHLRRRDNALRHHTYRTMPVRRADRGLLAKLSRKERLALRQEVE